MPVSVGSPVNAIKRKTKKKKKWKNNGKNHLLQLLQICFAKKKLHIFSKTSYNWIYHNFKINYGVTYVPHVAVLVGRKICALGYYKAYSGYSLPTFRNNLSVPSSRVIQLQFLADASGQSIGHETSVRNYYYTLCITQEDRRSSSRRKPENHPCLQEIKSTALECLPVAKFW
jgi:hypothetical protein